MSEIVQLQPRIDGETERRNLKLAQIFIDAAKRAKRGDFKMACWVAVSTEDDAQFGWQKFGPIVPLIGAVFSTAQEMANSPNLKLTELPEFEINLDDEPELPF